MSAVIDPYRDWLEIEVSDASPNYYELLGLEVFEGDAQRIEHHAMMQMAKVLREESGPNSKLARQISAELEEAIECLSDPKTKDQYDLLLRASGVTRKKQVAQDGFVLQQASPVENASEVDGLAEFLSLESTSKGVDEELEADQVASYEVEPTPSEVAPAKSSSANGKVKDHKPEGESARQRAKPPPATPKKPPKKPRAAMPQIPGSVLGLLGAGVAVPIVMYFVWPIIAAFLGPSEDFTPELADADPQVRKDAVTKLGSMNMPPEEEIGYLIKILKEDQDSEVRLAAVNVLVAFREELKPVMPEIQDLASKERHTATKGMLQIIVDRNK